MDRKHWNELTTVAGEPLFDGNPTWNFLNHVADTMEKELGKHHVLILVFDWVNYESEDAETPAIRQMVREFVEHHRDDFIIQMAKWIMDIAGFPTVTVDWAIGAAMTAVDEFIDERKREERGR